MSSAESQADGGKAAANNEEIAKNSSRNFVTVACKVPNGFVLQCYERVMSSEPSPSGAREVEVARKVGDSYTLNGPARPLTGGQAPYLIVGGYALTSNIPEKVWDKWLKDNRDADVVVNGLIFAHSKREVVHDKAREMKNVRSNMESLDPEGRNPDKSPKDPRMLRGIKKHEDSNMDAEAIS